MVKGFIIFLFLYLNIYKVNSSNGYQRDPNTCCDISRNSNNTDHCSTLVLEAEENSKYGSTPLFPLAFPINKMCSWTLRAPIGMRVRLEFRDFYLIGPGEDGQCFSQWVKVYDMITEGEMGPFCGNAGIPTIISGGNLLKIELTAPVPLSDENYRGFRMAFQETLETPSNEMAGDTSREKEINRLFPPPSTPAPPIPAMKTRPRFTTKPSRWNPNLRPFFYTTKKPFQAPAVDEVYGRDSPFHATWPRDNRQNTVIDYEANKNDEPLALQVEVIVGIVVGGIIVIAILVVIALKIVQIKKDKKTNEGNKDEEMNTPTEGGAKEKEAEASKYTVEKSERKRRSKERTRSRKKRDEKTSKNRSKRDNTSSEKRRDRKDRKEKSTKNNAPGKNSNKGKESEKTASKYHRKRIHVYEDVDLDSGRNKSPSKGATIRSDASKGSRSKKHGSGTRYEKSKNTAKSKRELKRSSQKNDRSIGKNKRTRSFVIMAEKYRKYRNKH